MTLIRAQAKSPRQIMIIAARARKSGRQLGITERSDQRNDAAQKPCGQKHRTAFRVSGDQRRRSENARADDYSDDQRDGVGHLHNRLRFGRARPHLQNLFRAGAAVSGPQIDRFRRFRLFHMQSPLIKPFAAYLCCKNSTNDL
jgi:hypothetical protein